MIETTIGFIAFGIVLIIGLIKLWNLANSGKVYTGKWIAIGLIMAIVCWGIYFTASMSALNQEAIWEDSTGELMQYKNNDYQTLFNFFPLLNILLLCIGAMSGIETFKVFIDIIDPSSMRQKYGYTPNPPTQEYNPQWNKPRWKN
ncbi:MAG TPA: hypothetical protein PKN54_02370 [Candidatus Cloacimonas acidaminovorans]|nr:hypothetical protein [Candidatus Cloacimonas acidaminovorans]